jgi:ribosomal protein S18 acetylase RimI-like enzyme
MSASEFNIQPVSEKDIAELVILSRQTFSDAFMHLNKAEDVLAYMNETFTEANLLQECQQPGAGFYFVEVNNELAGYIKLNTGTAQTEPEADDAMEIQRIYVLKAHQGRRIGERLILFAAQQAQQRHCSYIWLGVWEHNKNAIRFYQRHGFELYGEHHFLLGSDLQTDILMKKLS